MINTEAAFGLTLERSDPSPSSPPDAGHIHMTEEFDSAKWSLPPVVPVAGALLAVVLVVGAVAYNLRPKPIAETVITNLAASDQKGSTLVAVRVQITSKSEKQLWIRDIRSELETADGKKYPSHAVASSEAARYLKI